MSCDFNKKTRHFICDLICYLGALHPQREPVAIIDGFIFIYET